jgi:hypothetical protein
MGMGWGLSLVRLHRRGRPRQGGRPSQIRLCRPPPRPRPHYKLWTRDNGGAKRATVSIRSPPSDKPTLHRLALHPPRRPLRRTRRSSHLVGDKTERRGLHGQRGRRRRTARGRRGRRWASGLVRLRGAGRGRLVRRRLGRESSFGGCPAAGGWLYDGVSWCG